MLAAFFERASRLESSPSEAHGADRSISRPRRLASVQEGRLRLQSQPSRLQVPALIDERNAAARRCTIAR